MQTPITHVVQNSRNVSLPHLSIINGPRPDVGAAATVQHAATPTVTVAPALLLVGLDDHGKPHASWFDYAQADAAALAADVMGMAVIDVANDELAAIAAKLPKGKLFESGKAFVPFVKRETYERLAVHLDGEYAVSASARVEAARLAAAEGYAKASKGEVQPRLPEDWSKLIVGDQVLVTDDPDEGWFTAVIVEAMESDRYRLRWSSYPELPEFTRGIADIALLHPQCTTR